MLRIATIFCGVLASLALSSPNPTLKFNDQHLQASFASGSLELFGTLSAHESAKISFLTSELGRIGSQDFLPQGFVTQPSPNEVRIDRGSLQERITVNSEGIRQDFLIPERPRGWGQLVLNLRVLGASVHSQDDGTITTQLASGRTIQVHSLHVFDASGKELTAKMIATSSSQISIVVQDINADYPILIDPTFSDANWVKMSNGGVGTNEAPFQIDSDPDGSLYIGGRFSVMAGVPSRNLAQLKNGVWKNMGPGIPSYPDRLLSNKKGLVYVLYPDSGKNVIAKWNGTSWSALACSDTSIRLGLFTLNSANELYAGATKKQPDGSSHSLIVKWENNDWIKVHEWDVNQALDIRFNAKDEMYVYEYAAMRGILKWTGNDWDTLGTEFVYNWERGKLCGITQVAFDSKDQVYACVETTTVNNISVGGVSKWNGTSWRTVSGWTGHCQSLHIDANDNIIASDAAAIQLHDGSKWTQIGEAFRGSIYELFSTNEGEPMALGEFQGINNDPLRGIGKYKNGHWIPVNPGIDGGIKTMAVDSSGQLIVGGDFHFINGINANGVARWDGTQWHPYGSGPGATVNYLILDAKGYPVVACSKDSLARWNGKSWDLIPGFQGYVSSAPPITLMLDRISKDIIVATSNTLVENGIQYYKTFRWKADGTFSSFPTIPDGTPSFLAQDSSGCVFAARSQPYINSSDFLNQKQRIYMKCSDTWEDITDSVYQSIGFTQCFLKMDNKNRLFAGGNTGQIVVRENGVWKPFSTPFDSSVRTMAIDPANNLYVAGRFLHNNGKSFNRVAMWNGIEWLPLGSGLDTISSYTSAIDSKGNYYVSGLFRTAGNLFTPGLAMFKAGSSSNRLNRIEPTPPRNREFYLFDLLGRKQQELQQ